jgi:hypothetical protein
VVAICIVTALIVTLAAINSRNNFGRGMLGQRMQFETEGCSIPHITPFVELLPRRLFNFFTGSEKCASDSWKPFSTLKDGVLTIDCEEGKNKKHTKNLIVLDAYFVVNQDFLGQRESTLEFTNGEVLNITNLGRLRAIIAGKERKVTYKGPTRIADGEYIRAICGDKENYHLQNLLKPESLQRAQLITEEKKTTDKPNVVIILIDSLSRAHFMRRLPKTVEVPYILW